MIKIVRIFDLSDISVLKWIKAAADKAVPLDTKSDSSVVIRYWLARFSAI
jgi:hypothetical protein